MKEQGLCCGWIFLPTHFFARSIPVATFDQVTDEMFGPGWNLYCQTLGEDLTPQLIAEEAEHGDHLSAELIMEMARYLGATITTAVHVIVPAVVLLGGDAGFIGVAGCARRAVDPGRVSP